MSFVKLAKAKPVEEMESITMSSFKPDRDPNDQDQEGALMESNSNTDTRQEISSTQPRVPTSSHSIQSTVKVEGRKENCIDRLKICPLLLRVFYTYGRHHNVLDYKNKIYPKNELQIHTWMDATLSEIIVHLQRKNRKIRRSGTIIKFQIVSPDPARPRYKTRDIGSIKMDYKGPDDLKTLSQCRFMIGDFIDLCIRLSKN